MATPQHADIMQRSNQSANIVLVASVALIDKDGKILLAQRPKDKFLAQKWEFPGGKLNPNERAEEALIRELYEELNIKTHTSCLAPIAFSTHRYHPPSAPFFDAIVLLFACRVWQGDITPMEGQTTQWVNVFDMNKFDLLEGTKPLIALVRDYL